LRGEEIAVLLGIPAGTVASRKHNAIARLRALLGESAHA
jgi:RNA polymerase sigma-70 factor (ECF subfamily)